MIRELWHRYLDARRAGSLVLGALAMGLCVLTLALTPGFVVRGEGAVGGFARYGPLFGAALGMAVRGYAFHRKPGTRNGLRWAIAQGGLMALVGLGTFATATAIHPFVSRNPMLGGDAWLGLMAIAVVLGLSFGVLWERDRRRRRIGTVLLLAFCLIIVGGVGIRAGGAWILIGTPALVVGVIALFLVAVQGMSDLIQAVADSAA